MNDLELIVRQAQKGDDKAFYKLINYYKENLYSIAFAYLKNEHDSLDVVSDTIYKCYMDIKNIREPKFFKTWITKILINSATNKLKNNKRIIYVDEYEKIDFNEDKVSDLEFNISKKLTCTMLLIN